MNRRLAPKKATHDDAWHHEEDDAWMDEPIVGAPRTTSQVKEELRDVERALREKRPAEEDSTKSPQKKKNRREQGERKEAFEQWMHGNPDHEWVHVPACLVYRVKNGKMEWSTGVHYSGRSVREQKPVTIKREYGNLCYSEDGVNMNPSVSKVRNHEEPLDLDAHGHIGLFVCLKAKKWACHCCKCYGFIASNK